MDYKGKVVVITAAGNGIGREVAHGFARRGCKVVVSDRDGAAAESVAAEIVAFDGIAIGVACDVTSDADFEALAKSAKKYGPVDILMNHAGAAAAGPIELIPLDDWRWAFEVNVLGIVRGLRTFLPGMKERGSGLVINTGTGLALFPEVPIAAPYIGTKAAAVSLSEAMHIAGAPHGVRFMTLIPDITKTNFHFSGRMTGIDIAAAADAIPLSMEQPPSAVADALFVAIDEGRFMASNVPDLARLLREKAADMYEPKLRAAPQLDAAIQGQS